jgi:uncharacterized RmlC-like cupin family protein
VGFDMRERIREREILPEITAALRAQRERSFAGQVVISGRGRPFVRSRQGQERYYLTPSCYTGEKPKTALDNWIVFIQDVGKHSGKHRHQGGLVIYIIEGEGHTVIDGERLDWEAGDLMVLPIRPNGCEHQHFNKHEDRSVRWIAFIHTAIYEFCASDMVQVEKNPNWRGSL